MGGRKFTFLELMQVGNTEADVEKKKTIGIRLAIREEGDWLNAYLAKEETMADAKLIGSVLKGAMQKDHKLWEQWKGVMTGALSYAIEETLGVKPTFEHRTSPPHEKAGNA